MAIGTAAGAVSPTAGWRVHQRHPGRVTLAASPWERHARRDARDHRRSLVQPDWLQNVSLNNGLGCPCAVSG